VQAVRPRSNQTKESKMTEREHGEIKWFDVTRGFGFIATKPGADDVFVHATACPENMDLRVGDKVSFTREMGRNNKMQAAKVEQEN
jgi:CspA family cold shock protein